MEDVRGHIYITNALLIKKLVLILVVVEDGRGLIFIVSVFFINYCLMS